MKINMRVFKLEVRELSGRIFINFSLLILAILIFMEVATYFIMQKTISNINNNFTLVELRQKNEKLNNFVNELDTYSKTIISDKETLNQLMKNRYSGVTINGITHTMEYVLPSNIDAVFLFSNAGFIYSEADNELKEYVQKNIQQLRAEVNYSNGEMIFLDSRFINYADNSGENIFFVARKIRSIDTFEDIGIMLFAVRESVMWKNIYMKDAIGNFYITNTNGKIISCKNKDLIVTDLSTLLEKNFSPDDLKKDNGYYITGELIINSMYNKLTGWSLVNSVNIDETNSNFYYIQRIILVIGIIAIIIAVYISVLISSNISRPIKNLTSTMKRVSQGDLNVKSDLSLIKGATKEVRELSEVFNYMTVQLQTLLDDCYNKGLKEKDAELRALRAQIQPHFIYNTLDTVYWMLIERNDYDIAEMVTKLGEILRYSIKKGSTNVHVKEEINQMKNYLYLQKSRFEDNLEYEINIESDILECEMLSFIIQPFIENAINHGIMEEKGHGKVILNGFRRGENLIFEIIDDGMGMTSEKVTKLFIKSSEDRESQGGIGVLNVHERIKNYYGDYFGIQIESVVNGGTKVIVEIPVKKID